MKLFYFMWTCCIRFLHTFKIDAIVDHPLVDETENNEEEEEEKEKEEESPWSWEEYLDLYSAAYPSCQQEEDEFHLAYYDETDFDPALFLNAGMPWIPR